METNLNEFLMILSISLVGIVGLLTWLLNEPELWILLTGPEHVIKPNYIYRVIAKHNQRGDVLYFLEFSGKNDEWLTLRTFKKLKRITRYKEKLELKRDRLTGSFTNDPKEIS